MSQNYEDPDADVIIIGAGVSGLTAAYTLLTKEPTVSVIVLEATDRLGGRTLSIPLADENSFYDLGGQWISSEQKELIRLLNSLNIKTRRYPNIEGKVIIDCNGHIFKKNKKNIMDFCNPIDKLNMSSFLAKFEKQSLPENLTSLLTMEEFINNNILSPTIKAMFKYMILCHCGVEAAQLTLAFYIFFCMSTHGIINQLLDTTNGLHELWIEGGAQKICDSIAESLEEDVTILKNTEVTSITTYNLQVKIETKDGNYCSSYVIVAIPPSAILEINFTPPLPSSKMSILRNAADGKLVKFVITYSEAFWKRLRLSGEIHIIMNQYNEGSPVLTCFDVTTGNTAVLSGCALKVADQADIKTLILKQLSKYFGTSALTPLEFVAKEWTYGSPMSCYNSYDTSLFETSHKRIYWAGAETSLDWFGTIAGAANAGSRAAKEVLYDLRPSCLNTDDLDDFLGSLSRINHRIFNSIYKKLLNPYYQATAFVILFLLIKLLRRTGIYSCIKNSLRNIVIKT